MAKTDDTMKITSCPICGYTDTASDPEALYSAIEEHVRMAHNMDLSSLNTEPQIKTAPEGADTAPDIAAPVGAFVPRMPGPGPTGQGTA